MTKTHTTPTYSSHHRMGFDYLHARHHKVPITGKDFTDYLTQHEKTIVLPNGQAIADIVNDVIEPKDATPTTWPRFIAEFGLNSTAWSDASAAHHALGVNLIAVLDRHKHDPSVSQDGAAGTPWTAKQFINAYIYACWDQGCYIQIGDLTRAKYEQQFTDMNDNKSHHND